MHKPTHPFSPHHASTLPWRTRLLAGVAAALLLLSACGPAPTATTPPPSPTRGHLSPTPTQPAPTTPAPTALPTSLTLCTPPVQRLNLYAATTATEYDLLSLITEPPAEQVAYRWYPRLLATLPEIAVTEVSVPAQGVYVDETGAQKTHTGTTPLRLPQMSVTYTLRSDLRWSDGTPLTAEDVLLGYALARDAAAQGGWSWVGKMTERLEAVNSVTLHWVGRPGLVSSAAVGWLFPPQPAARWRGQGLAEVVRDPLAPVTGPFMPTSWRADGITLARNPYYSGEAPTLERIEVRFVQVKPEQLPELLARGTCDVLAPELAQQLEWKSWEQTLQSGAAVMWATPQEVFLRLDFNTTSTRAPMLRDAAFRRALSGCLNRTRLVNALAGQFLIPAQTFLLPQHPAYAVMQDLTPEEAQTQLTALGWEDRDGDGIREAHGAPGVAEGTPLTLSLTLPSWYTVAAAMVAADLETCGVKSVPQVVSAQTLYAADARSPLAGRSFELALYGWNASPPTVCGAWLSTRIPNAATGYQGENFTGYASPVYDAACRRALQAVELAEQVAALHEAQAALLTEMPTAFLAWRASWLVARSGIEGFRLDPTAPGAFWNAEQWRVVARQP